MILMGTDSYTEYMMRMRIITCIFCKLMNKIIGITYTNIILLIKMIVQLRNLYNQHFKVCLLLIMHI